jgi:hypothetical protein
LLVFLATFLVVFFGALGFLVAVALLFLVSAFFAAAVFFTGEAFFGDAAFFAGDADAAFFGDAAFFAGDADAAFFGDAAFFAGDADAAFFGDAAFFAGDADAAFFGDAAFFAGDADAAFFGDAAFFAGDADAAFFGDAAFFAGDADAAFFGDAAFFAGDADAAFFGDADFLGDAALVGLADFLPGEAILSREGDFLGDCFLGLLSLAASSMSSERSTGDSAASGLFRPARREIDREIRCSSDGCFWSTAAEEGCPGARATGDADTPRSPMMDFWGVPSGATPSAGVGGGACTARLPAASTGVSSAADWGRDAAGEKALAIQFRMDEPRRGSTAASTESGFGSVVLPLDSTTVGPTSSETTPEARTMSASALVGCSPNTSSWVRVCEVRDMAGRGTYTYSTANRSRRKVSAMDENVLIRAA